MGEKTKIQWTDATWHQKSAAKRIGLTASEYLARMHAGLKWCVRCKDWHDRSVFCIDRSRWDRLSSKCTLSRLNPPRKLSREEKLERNRKAYRAYYAGKGGASIRATKYARRRNCEPVSPRDRELVFEAFDGLCAYCCDPATTIDHVVPISSGGSSKRGNILPACSRCNSKKGTKHLDRFLSKIPFFNERIPEELCMEDVL